MTTHDDVWYVYVDRTADNDTPFYVGKGNSGRVKKIQRNRKHSNISKKHGLNRTIIAEVRFEEDAFEIEKLKIAELHTFIDDPEATRLACNMTMGGEGVSNPSIETRQKISKARQNCPPISDETRYKISESNRRRKGEKRSPETRKKLSEAARNRSPETHKKMSEAQRNRPPISDETRKKMSDANRGKKRSPETRKKISEASRNRSPETRKKLSNAARNRSPETCKKISEAARNRPPISEETRRKLSDAARNRSPETRKKLSEANQGRKFSPETRKKMSDAQRGQKLSPETLKKMAASQTRCPICGYLCKKDACKHCTSIKETE